MSLFPIRIYMYTLILYIKLVLIYQYFNNIIVIVLTIKLFKSIKIVDHLKDQVISIGIFWLTSLIICYFVN